MFVRLLAELLLPFCFSCVTNRTVIGYICMIDCPCRSLCARRSRACPLSRAPSALATRENRKKSRGAAAGGKGVERSSSLQRIASAGTLAAGPKATLGDGTASPAIGEDSPRGFVPFRSLQSYENLLSLQAQTR